MRRDGSRCLVPVGWSVTLPDPPGRCFDSDRVDASGDAYELARTPDSALGLASYTVSLALIGAGPGDRARRHPWLPIAQTAKLALDVVSAGVLTVEQVSKHRALCFWYLLSAAATVAALPPSLPETREALARLRSA